MILEILSCLKNVGVKEEDLGGTWDQTWAGTASGLDL